MRISILITAWKEEKSIKKLLDTILEENYSQLNLKESHHEILLASPDEKTIRAAREKFDYYNLSDKLKIIVDAGKGKPNALNELIKVATGDFWVFTDGDVYLGPSAIPLLLSKFKDTSVGIVSGRPTSSDKKDNFFGYIGHLLADAAHHKRMIDLTDEARGLSVKILPRRHFFPVSGYLYAVRKMDNFKFPEDCLVDDAYISYHMFNIGWKVAYVPDAIVFVKYPKTLSDYFKQKKRSTGGYVQLWNYKIVTKNTKSRTFLRELEYFWFPIKYAQNFKELVWSFLLYPLRMWLWIKIYWERKIINKPFEKTWTRVESTK